MIKGLTTNREILLRSTGPRRRNQKILTAVVLFVPHPTVTLCNMLTAHLFLWLVIPGWPVPHGDCRFATLRLQIITGLAPGSALKTLFIIGKLRGLTQSV